MLEIPIPSFTIVNILLVIGTVGLLVQAFSTGNGKQCCPLKRTCEVRKALGNDETGVQRRTNNSDARADAHSGIDRSPLEKRSDARRRANEGSRFIYRPRRSEALAGPIGV